MAFIWFALWEAGTMAVRYDILFSLLVQVNRHFNVLLSYYAFPLEKYPSIVIFYLGQIVSRPMKDHHHRLGQIT